MYGTSCRACAVNTRRWPLRAENGTVHLAGGNLAVQRGGNRNAVLGFLRRPFAQGLVFFAEHLNRAVRIGLREYSGNWPTWNASGFDTPRTVDNRISRGPGAASGAMVTSTTSRLETETLAGVCTNSLVRYCSLAINSAVAGSTGGIGTGAAGFAATPFAALLSAGEAAGSSFSGSAAAR